MSYTKVPNTIIENMQKFGLSAFDVVVYVVLRSFDFNKGVAYPSIRTIAQITGFSLATIEKSIKKLESVALIAINKEKNHNVYKFTDMLIEDDINPQRHNDSAMKISTEIIGQAERYYDGLPQIEKEERLTEAKKRYHIDDVSTARAQVIKTIAARFVS